MDHYIIKLRKNARKRTYIQSKPNILPRLYKTKPGTRKWGYKNLLWNDNTNMPGLVPLYELASDGTWSAFSRSRNITEEFVLANADKPWYKLWISMHGVVSDN